MDKDINIAEIMYHIRDEFDYSLLPDEIAVSVEKNNNSNKLNNSRYVNTLVEKYKKYENIIIFGSGTYGKQVLNILEENGVRTIWCLCDNQIRNGLDFTNGKRILNISDAIRRFPDALYIITPKYSSNTIFRQLINIGVPVEQISFFVIGYI